MRRKPAILLLFHLLTLTAFGQSKPYTIKALKAYLYYNGENPQDPKVRGSLSENLIDNGEFALWNTIIGEGSAKAESNQTLVVVELSGNPKGYVGRTLRLTVTTNGKQVFRQAQDFAILDEAKNYSVAFLMYNTGCQPLKLTAEIVAVKTIKKKSSTVEASLTKTLPFACGE